jgi:hypothetical protein
VKLVVIIDKCIVVSIAQVALDVSAVHKHANNDGAIVDVKLLECGTVGSNPVDLPSVRDCEVP